MTRELLTRAIEDVEAASEAAPDDAGERLARLADHLRAQAERKTTPALGALDRIQYGLEAVADGTDDEALAERLERARERILAFLETLDDRGMRQHGMPEAENGRET